MDKQLSVQDMDKEYIKQRLEQCIELHNQFIGNLNSAYSEFILPMPEIKDTTRIITYQDFVVYGVGLEDEFAVGYSWFINDWETVSQDIAQHIDEQIEKWASVVEMD